MSDPRRRSGNAGDLLVHHRSGEVRVLSHRKDDDSGWWLLEGGGLYDGVPGWTTVRRADVAAALFIFVRKDTP